MICALGKMGNHKQIKKIWNAKIYAKNNRQDPAKPKCKLVSNKNHSTKQISAELVHRNDKY